MQNIPERMRDFNNLINEIKLNYPEWKSGLKRCDDLTQDYLHQLELESLNAIQRTKIANELVKVRQQRRKLKNLIEVTEAMRNWFNYNNNSVQNLQNTVVSTLRTQSEIETKVYKFKVLSRNDIQ